MKKALVITLIFLVLLFIGRYLGNGYTPPTNTKMDVNDLDLLKMLDGKYIGEHETLLVSVCVEVMIEQNQIVGINILEHHCGKGQPAEAIIDDVIKQQSLDVDVVCGATVSSKVILRAVEDAIMSGYNE